jgi:hypothetical protein
VTYTYAILDVSPAAWNEIAEKLRAVGYHHVFDRDVMDMHGIALRAEKETTNATEASDQGDAGAGVLRDGAARRRDPGPAAGRPGGEDTGAEGSTHTARGRRTDERGGCSRKRRKRAGSSHDR